MKNEKLTKKEIYYLIQSKGKRKDKKKDFIIDDNKLQEFIKKNES